MCPQGVLALVRTPKKGYQLEFWTEDLTDNPVDSLPLEIYPVSDWAALPVRYLL